MIYQNSASKLTAGLKPWHSGSQSSSQPSLFYWSMTALQRCVSFCCTMKRTRQMCTHIPSLLSLLPAHCPIPPSRSSQSPELSSLCHTAALHQLPALHVVLCTCQYQAPSSCPTPAPCPQIHSLCLHLCSYPANRYICIIFLDSTYMG